MTCIICGKGKEDSYSFVASSRIHYDCVLKKLEKNEDVFVKLIAKEWNLVEKEVNERD